jgi:hypothetical protein
MTPVPHPSIEDVVLGSEVVVFDERTALVYRLNPSAAVIWGLSDGTRTIDDIAVELASAVDADHGTLQEQVRCAVFEFELRGLVVDGSDG